MSLQSGECQLSMLHQLTRNVCSIAGASTEKHVQSTTCTSSMPKHQLVQKHFGCLPKLYLADKVLSEVMITPQ